MASQNVAKNIFTSAIKKNASDVHILVGRPPVFRIDGELILQNDFPVFDQKNAKDFVYSILTDVDAKKFENDKEIDLAYDIADMGRFRINCYWERGNVALAGRLIPPNIPTMEELLIPKAVYDLAQLHQGLVLVTGPTGCGKSTTLASMLDRINTERSVNIITLEDPIEFLHWSKKSIISQRQLGEDMKSFPDALKFVVRQDPNVILVGEMRDLDTIATTITLAETGHLVFATLHTLSASQTIDRIIDVFPPHQQNQIRMQLSLSLRGVISQLLLPKIGGGRIAAREILLNNPAIANLIRENKIPQIKSIIQTSRADGMLTMDHSLTWLAKQGLITRETAIAHASNPKIMEI